MYGQIRRVSAEAYTDTKAFLHAGRCCEILFPLFSPFAERVEAPHRRVLFPTHQIPPLLPGWTVPHPFFFCLRSFTPNVAPTRLAWVFFFSGSFLFRFPPPFPTADFPPPASSFEDSHIRLCNRIPCRKSLFPPSNVLPLDGSPTPEHQTPLPWLAAAAVGRRIFVRFSRPVQHGPKGRAGIILLSHCRGSPCGRICQKYCATFRSLSPGSSSRKESP